MPDHITDDEYQRLIAQDNAEEPGDPWRRLGPYPAAPNEDAREVLVNIAVPKRRRLVQPRVGTVDAPSPTCPVCTRRRGSCICLG